MKALLIFDLDGTLADSKKDLTVAVNHVRQQFDLSILTQEEVSRFIGDGAQMLIRRALGDKAEEKNVELGLKMFLAFYRAHMLDHTVLYPGVRETLDELSGHDMAVLTNKPVHFSKVMLEGLGIIRHFRVVYGGNSFEQKKPNPVGIHQILADTNRQKEHAWMIGDSAVDVWTGRNAGITTCGVTYGYAAASFQDARPDYLIERFSELPHVIP